MEALKGLKIFAALRLGVGDTQEELTQFERWSALDDDANILNSMRRLDLLLIRTRDMFDELVDTVNS